MLLKALPHLQQGCQWLHMEICMRSVFRLLIIIILTSWILTAILVRAVNNKPLWLPGGDRGLSSV